MQMPEQQMKKKNKIHTNKKSIPHKMKNRFFIFIKIYQAKNMFIFFTDRLVI